MSVSGGQPSARRGPRAAGALLSGFVLVVLGGGAARAVDPLPSVSPPVQLPSLPSVPLPTVPLPTPTLRLPTPTLPLPTPTLPLPTPLPTLPSLPLPTPTLPPTPSLPIPTPTLPIPTPTPSGPAGSPSSVPSSSASPSDAGESPSVAPGGLTSGGSPVPGSSVDPGFGVTSSGGFLPDFLVPALALGVPFLLLAAVVLAHVMGGAAWLPVIHRVLGSNRLPRPRRPNTKAP
jgi:hypothetical protein